ncbi:MAG: CAP domain-containing protein [Patescibacteria group bacterium]|nr:CAP domain-containing protein [Patescibacteria group bacterium]
MKTKNKNKSINKISFVVALFFALAGLLQESTALGASISAVEMINLTNNSRMEAGLHSLSMNEKLTEAAKEKANDMFEFQYFDHNSPSGLTPWDFIKSTGYNYRYAGENLAIDFVTATSVHSALMESSSHRENILNSNYTEVGIVAIEGIFDGSKSIIIVEEFGAPLLLERVSIDYELNENIELVLEEKVNDINILKNDNEEKNNVSEKTENLISLSDKEQNEIELLSEKKMDNEQASLLLSDSTSHSDDGNIFSGLFKNNQNEILYCGYEDLKNKFQQSKTRSLGYNSNEENNNKIITKCDPILLAENIRNMNVAGLIKKAYAEDKQIKKYDYYQEPIGLTGSNYFKNGFIPRVFLCYTALIILLVSNLMAVIYFYMEKGNVILELPIYD